MRFFPYFLFPLIFIPFHAAVAQDEQTQSGLGQTETTDDPIIVYGRGLELIGNSGAASEGTVGYADFEDRPLSRTGELVEVIPGAVATQHSGEGKANQYFLRGFNLDHGTDFSAYIDGVPINLRTHGHGQGYLDLNFIIPEIIERVDYRKGPYRASTGDFSSAGSARYVTRDRLDRDFIDLSIGEFGYLRGVAAADFSLSSSSNILIAAEGVTHNGPWVLDQDLEKFNGFAKLNHRSGPWNLTLSASAYDSSWAATDQVPQRAVASGLIDRFGFIDDDLGGSSTRFGVNGAIAYQHEKGTETEFQAYAVSYDFSLFSNFTYFLDDPVNGDEFEQRDKRAYFGARLAHSQSLSDRLQLRIGMETRYDDISDIGLFRTADRQRLSTVRRDKVEEFSLSLWGEAEIALTERLRATIGLRGDYFSADVTAISLPANGGSANDSLWSPSAALAWQLVDGVELYGNYGRGFHSNDARGATIKIDPQSGAPTSQVPLLVRSEGAELGIRLESGSFRASLALFTLDLDSELVFVGDAGTTEANDASTRSGVEASLFWLPNDWLVADLSFAHTDAKFDIPGDDTAIPGAVETVIGGGLLARFAPFTISARLRHFGKAPLIEDGSVTSQPTTLVNLGATYEWNNISFSLEILNAFDARDSDISYFFESQLRGEAASVEDVHFHPVEPRQLRIGARFNF